jgi:peroxiredoxin (alkyl hydroperoxide reductase subunit C)
MCGGGCGMGDTEMTLEIGDEFPDIELRAYDPKKDEDVTLKTGDYKGKWKIFFFYPADFTFVCPTELEELAGLYPEFEKEGAEIFSVSTDTVFTHKAWHEHSEAIKKVQFPMVADPAGELSKMFGVYIGGGDDVGLALRGSFIVDPNSIVKTIEVNDNAIGRSGKELLRKLRAAKFVYENGDKVCPASWEPGGDTLTPGMDLVGKI